MLNTMAKFISPAMEEKYRFHYLKQEKQQLKIAVLVLMLPAILFIYSDYLLFGTTSSFFTLIYARALYIMVSVAILILLRRTKTVKRTDLLILIWWLSLVVLVFYVNTTRPSDYLLNSVIDILLVFGMYVGIPSRLSHQVTPAVIFTAGNISLILIIKTTSPMALTVILVSYAIGNALGFVHSHRSHTYRRLEFAALQKEKELRKNLENALSEIKELRGIIPICCNCKKIRDDSGFWRQVEEYMGHHMDADFTHSVCPDCARALYPEVDWDKE